MKRTINSCDTPAPAASNIRAETNYRMTKELLANLEAVIEEKPCKR
jgi:superfamily I DNA/RNA helicase